MITDSGGAALGGRQALEATYQAAARPAVQRFLKGVQRLALAGTLTGVWVLANWENTIAEIRETSPQAAEYMRDSEIPSQAQAAALLAVSLATTLALSTKERRSTVAAALGLERGDLKGTGREFGRILGPDGAYSWIGASDAAARTAATADFGASMLQQLKDEGYTHKRWMTRYDLRVRETHADVDRETIPLDEEFIVGGIALRFPGDPMSADVGEVINCRCVLFGVNLSRRPWDFPEGEEPWNNPRPPGI